VTRPNVVLTDIEGTTSRIAFVRDTLFPYARSRLADFLAAHGEEPAVAAELDAVARLAPGQDRLATLLAWMDEDAKQTPLKALQGMIWREGYQRGALQGDLYPDVAPALRSWAHAGVRLCVYSSGSVEAQHLIFGHSVAGDLTPLFFSFFDTRVGPKREAASYRRIADELASRGPEILFLSDVAAELDAAAAAGMQTCQLARAEDGTAPSQSHPVASDFPQVAGLFGLPEVSSALPAAGAEGTR
jgi:enolase-phosphatase E1